MEGYSALLVEDRADDAVSIQRLLRDEGISEWRIAASAREAVERVKEHGPFDVHIFDLHLPDASDLELLESLTKAGFRDWDKSIVVTGVADSEKQGQAIASYGMPVVEKDVLARSLSPWVKGIIRRAPDAQIAAMVAALGAACWGNGLCSFLLVNEATPRQINELIPDASALQVSETRSIVLLPQVGMRDAASFKETLSTRLPGLVRVDSLVLTDVESSHDFRDLAGRALGALSDPNFQDAIWPMG